MQNIAAIGVLLSFAALGILFVFKLVTRRKCQCKLCNIEYQLIDKLGSGGYGQVLSLDLLPPFHSLSLTFHRCLTAFPC